jgi:flagellar motor component MotA
MENNKKPSLWDFIGAAILGAFLGLMFAYGFMNGGF